jgi:hypothetical protein
VAQPGLFVDGEPVEQEADYFADTSYEQHRGRLELHAEDTTLSVEDSLRLQAARLHPRARSHHERLLAELALCTSQTVSKKEPKEPQHKLSRQEKALQWRASLGTKPVQERLDQLVAQTGNKRSVAQKLLKKYFLGKLGRSAQKCRAAKNRMK